MTSVNVTAVTNTVTVTEGDTTVVAVATAGPQGPIGPEGTGLQVDTTATIDKSIVYYDAGSAGFRADSIWTTTTLSDGGNF